MITQQPATENSCEFCGLPIFYASETPEPQYCCYGCRFAASLTAAGGDEGQARWTMTRLGLAVFFSMNVMVFTMLLWSQPEESSQQLAVAWYDLGRYACLLFTLPVVMLLGNPLLEDAVAELRRGKASLSLLLLVGVGASLAYSLYSLTTGGHVYFEVACAILVAVTLGRWLEANGKLQTTESLRGLEKLLPDQVRLVIDGFEQLHPIAELQPGGCFRVLAGERIAADGQIDCGESSIDEQAVTGESVPVFKRAGDTVISGTLVVDGTITVQASAAAGQGTMARMIEAVKQAASRRTRYERLAETISRWFLPAVAIIAVGTFVTHFWSGRMEQGLLSALAVLVIACPCALGLATPMALWAALGRAAKAGILVRDGDAFSLLAKAKTICFDKTGTLTTGQARVVEFAVVEATQERTALAIAGSLAAASAHPLAVAVARFVAERGEPVSITSSVASVRSIPGRGITGTSSALKGPAFLGNRRWLDECSQDVSAITAGNQTQTETLIAWNGRVRGQFLFQETLRPGIDKVIASLSGLGLESVMLTGDRRDRAEAFARPLQLAYRAELLPQDKLAAIETLRKNLGPVVMVGDGINDAPALAAADIGVALGSGADISRHTAGVCLLKDDLTLLPWLIELSRRTVHTIRWNLLWALIYNVVGIGLAAVGWLHPIIAAIAMGLSSLLVISNSLLLANFSEQSSEEETMS